MLEKEDISGGTENIKDEEIISMERFCPQHYLPHKFPFGKKIADEPCHIHKKMYNIIHHKFFCYYLKCVNYDFMVQELKSALEK